MQYNTLDIVSDSRAIQQRITSTGLYRPPAFSYNQSLDMESITTEASILSLSLLIFFIPFQLLTDLTLSEAHASLALQFSVIIFTHFMKSHTLHKIRCFSLQLICIVLSDNIICQEETDLPRQDGPAEALVERNDVDNDFFYSN